VCMLEKLLPEIPAATNDQRAEALRCTLLTAGG